MTYFKADNNKLLNLRNNCTAWLIKWVNSSHNMTLHDTSCFKKLNKPYTLYRGLAWSITEEIKQLNSDKDLHKYTVGSNIYLSLNQFSSWTKSEKIAEDFSFVRTLGIILKIVVDPKYVLVDIPITFNETYKIEHAVEKEVEVILHPSRYKCEIIQINNQLFKDNNKDLSFGMYKNSNIDSDK